MTKTSYEGSPGADTEGVCPKCSGRGITYVKSKRAIAGKKPGSQVFLMDSIPCICKRNEMVEGRYDYLSRVSVPAITAEEAASVVEKLKPLSTNILFQGGSYKFFHVVKAVLVHYAFNAKLVFHMSKGIEVVSQYYVEQVDESGRKFEDLIYNRDLVILMFNSRVENRALKPVLQELIEGRFLRNRPTWIWSREIVESTQDYSAELKPFLDKYKRVSCGTADVRTKKEHESAEQMRSLGSF